MAPLSRLSNRVTDDNAKWWTLIAACFALFMAILDNLVVNVALPTISRDLEPTPAEFTWIVSAYILVFAALQITAGGLGDRFGRKRWFLGGIAVFTLTSAVAALANSVELLIAMRAIQGLGAAFILPLSLSLISEAFPPEERGRALGIWSAISVSGLALGPVVGGLLVEYASWHWIFLVNVPIGIAAFLVTLAVVPESRDTSGTVATDIPGTVVITGAVGGLTYGLITAGERGWTDGRVLTAFAVAAVLFPLFVLIEARTAKPMVPLRFFRSSTFTGANIDAFAVSFLIAGVAFAFTLYLQNVLGFSAVRAGSAILPLVAVMMVGAPITGALVNRVGARILISIGMIISGAGMLLFLRARADGSYWDILPAYLVLGFGNSMIFAPMTTAVLNSVESAKSGVASAVNGAIREIGNSFGIALLGTLMNRAYREEFNANGSVDALRDSADPALAPLRPLIGQAGEGVNYAGEAVYELFRRAGLDPSAPGLAPVADGLRRASGQSFMAGMDLAVIVSAVGIMTASVVSFFLIKDRVALTEGVADPATGGDGVLASGPAA